MGAANICWRREICSSYYLFIYLYRLQIGLMRSGHLLAEESPSVLLSMYKCISLEEVFLKLSRIQSQKGEISNVNFR